MSSLKMYKHIFLVFCCVFFVYCQDASNTTSTTEWWGIVGRPLRRFLPCKGVENIQAIIEVGRPPGEENQYEFQFYKTKFTEYSKLVIKFDSPGTVTLKDKSVARITSVGETFIISFFKSADWLYLDVKGPPIGTVPYPITIKRDYQEMCKEPNTGFLDDLIVGYQDTAESSRPVKQTGCGRRQIDHTELIYNGQPTKPGDWPWHAAIYRLEYTSAKYVCGGTLIAKSFVLTAGHCVTINGVPVVPQILSVVLGKYNLIGGDIAIQERLVTILHHTHQRKTTFAKTVTLLHDTVMLQVHQVIVHEEYFQKRLDNDIALIKLRTEAIYDDYVQPACVWNIDAIKRLPAGILYGTVVGWGLNHTNELSSQLHQATLPKIGDQTCLKSNPIFFGTVLNGRKFCAGYTNGTSACNGDSGGGFLVFISDIPGDTSPNATGAWYVNGIVSLAVKRPDIAVCDTTQYTLYTDIHAFMGWIDARIRSL